MESFERLFYQSQARAERLRNKARDLGATSGGLVLAIGGERQGGALISPCPTEMGRWRVTRFDCQGWIGHTVLDTKEKAILHAFQEGYADRDRDLLSRLSRTDRFREGNERLEKMRIFNEALASAA